MNEENAFLATYLTSIFPEWKKEVPLLPTYFEEIQLERGEPLPSQRGDIYFVQRGTIGKYLKNIPQRYIQANQLIIVPLIAKPPLFKALEDSTILLLPLPVRYQIARQYPCMIEVYDHLRAKQEKDVDFRTSILEMPRTQRLKAFRSKFERLDVLLPRIELAQFLGISREYLRKIF
ncbi:hypothetical protein [Sphingobacterium sp. LRF_L2]|uniref:hypothetical protein n=1 Tax=Sphingobacterium sp. LRF_L2 TaxID=3369421 RepID=UPI003F5EC06D